MVQISFSRPNWCQFCPKLEGSGFRSQLVHFFPGPGSGSGFPGYFSSSSAMCGHHVSQFGRIILILIKFPKQRLSLGCTPHTIHPVRGRCRNRKRKPEAGSCCNICCRLLHLNLLRTAPDRVHRALLTHEGNRGKI